MQSVAATVLTKNILAETRMSFAAVSREYGQSGGAPINASTPFRWATKGVKTSDGRTIKLEAVKLGSRWITSKEAVERFVARTTAASMPPEDNSPAPRSPAARDRAATAAEAELDALGVR
jgi:hypothetical protein